MAVIEIPQLVFSTRAAVPKIGSEFTREVVARSAGYAGAPIDEGIVDRFAGIADLILSTGHQESLAPVYAFEPVGPDHWLACRFISLGIYRKTSHHMLVHGLVLDIDAALALRADPFLLAPSSGLPLAGPDDHPGRNTALDVLRFDGDRAVQAARQAETRRLVQLDGELAAWHDHFPTFFDGLRRAKDPRAPFAVVNGDHPPDSRILEWLWLHLHPADRMELALHTWPVYDSPRTYDLVMGRERDWTSWRRTEPTLRRLPAAQTEEGSRVCRFTRRLLSKEPERFQFILDRYRLTHVSRRGLEPLADGDALLVLAKHLGATSLKPEEEARIRVLAKRGSIPLLFHTEEMAALWPQGGDRLLAEAERRAADPEILLGGLADIDTVLETLTDPALSPAAGTSDDGLNLLWAAWVLIWGIQERAQSDARAGLRRELGARFRRHMSADGFSTFLGACPPSHRALAEKALWSLVLATVEDRLGGPSAESDPRYWPELLRHLVAQDLSPVRPAAELERTLLSLDEARERAADAAWIEELRNLEKVLFELGQHGFALKIRLQRRAPRLDPRRRDALLRQSLRDLLDGPGDHDAALRAPLARTDLCAPLWQELTAWLLEEPSSEARWQRWLGLFESLADSLGDDRGPEAGALLTSLALSPHGTKLVHGLQALLEAGPEDADDSRRFEDHLWRRFERGLWQPLGGPVDDAWVGILDNVTRLRLDLDDGSPHRLDGILARWALPLLVGVGRLSTVAEPARSAIARWIELLLRRDDLVRTLEDESNPCHWCDALFDLFDVAGDGDDDSPIPSILNVAVERLVTFVDGEPETDARPVKMRRLAARFSTLASTSRSSL